MNATSTPGAATAPLTRSDRCDRCPAAAIMRAVLGEAGELLFCGHHARAVEATLKPLSSDWHDETGKLHEKAAVEID